MIKELKPKKCKSCGAMFKPFSSLAKVCSMACSLDYVGTTKQKAEEKNIKKKKKEFNSETNRMKKEFYVADIKTRREAAVKYFNRYILLRDKDKPCVSCGNTNPSIKYDAGHYIPAGSCSALRFDERNVHKQCSQYCNVHRSGNSAPYAKAIAAMYGQEVLDFLDGPQPKIKITASFYQSVEDEYKEKIRIYLQNH
jgi:hypothetical protein